MSDPFDPVTIGGAGASGVALATILARVFKSTDIADLKSEFKSAMSELKQEVKTSIQEQRADTREQLAGLRELMARNDERHDRAVEEVTKLRTEVAAAHRRLDVVSAEVHELQRSGR